MAKISVTDARAFADLLTQGADAAETSGLSEFDLTAAAEAKYGEALKEAQAAVDAAADPAAK